MKQLSVFWGMERKRKTKYKEEKTKLISTAGWTAKFRVPADRFQEVPVMFIVRELLVMRIHRSFRWMSSTSAGRRILHFGLNRRIIIQSESCNFTVGNILPHNDQS